MHFVTMAWYPGKRKSEAVDLTTNGSDDSDARAAKISRTASSLSPEGTGTSTGQRFGESTEFLPLNQLSQVAGADEDDAQAADLVQGSQDVDESSMGSFVLYGRRSSRTPRGYLSKVHNP